MSLLKKIILLLISFLILNVISIYGFDYNGFLGKNENTASFNEDTKNENDLLSEINGIKEKVFDSFNEKQETKPFNLVLIKKNGVVEMNGLFGNEEDAKKVFDLLNINKEGEYKYEKNRVIDEYLLEELSILISPFKDFFEDDSKLSIIDNELSLSGKLKDSNYKDLLDSILTKLKVDVKLDITVPDVISIEEIKKSVYSDNENVLSPNIESKEITKNLDKEIVPSNKSSKSNELQLQINTLLANKKINFERRSSKITEDSNLVVQEIANILKENPSLKIEIAGHTDSRGKASLNKQISQDRASSVRDVLISLGVNKDKITAVGYGEDFPIAKDDENGLSEINRRVEFNILGE
jgi:OmpA-OmpF porin, OOP family